MLWHNVRTNELITNDTTRLWKSNVGICFQQFLVAYYDPIRGSFLYC